jgi:hypothetical protein
LCQTPSFLSADASQTSRHRRVGRNDGRGFRQTVALHNPHARAGENQRDFIGNRRAARNAKTQPAAEELAEFGKNQTVGDAVFGG